MSNLTATTRELWESTVVDEVFKKTALFAMLMAKRRMSIKGGSSIKYTVKKATTEDLSQDYVPGQGMTAGSSTLFANPEFKWKYTQQPVRYGIREQIENKGGKETAPVDLVKELVKAGHEGARIHFASLFYTVNGTASDAGAKFQSVVDALDMTCTPYGGIARTATSAATNNWWLGASPAGTWTDQDTAVSPSIANLRIWIDRCRTYGDPSNKLFVICGSSIFRSFKSQCEARSEYSVKGSELAYGFDTMVIDGVEFVKDPYLDILTSGTTDKYLFILDPETWEFRLNEERAFTFTGFTWQGDQAGGVDEYLARIMCTGNLCCKKPNANMFLSNVA
jgi:hypothetical protein